MLKQEMLVMELGVLVTRKVLRFRCGDRKLTNAPEGGIAHGYSINEPRRPEKDTYEFIC
jgi:hypothetical protein